MAPALTKILKNAHGIHLSSPPASTTVDSDGRAAMCSIDPGTRPDDGDLQKIWLNLSSFGSLDSCLPSSLLDSPVANPMLSPCLQMSVSRREAEMSLPSPGSLVNLLSSNKSQADSHQVASVFPGVPDMFLVPVPEHKSQEACLLHGYSAALECGPDGGDVHHSSLTLSSVCPLYSHGEIQFQGYTPLLATPPTLTQENVAAENCPQASLEPCINRVNFLQLASKAALEEAAKEQLYRHAELQGRAWRLRRRLQALLGEHALCHCSQQLEGLKKHYQLENVPLDSLDSIHHGELPSQVDRKPHFSWPESLSSYTEVREFSRSSQMVLRGLQEALDSEATASSSSDEEPEEMIHGKTSPVNSSNEKLWLEERAEVSSRWSWLQLRLAELEARVQQLVELHKHIRSTKGGVVLADSQPLTDRQIQQRLLREMAGLYCTASDADTEPCSPTRLLHNIERQSAQLSQFVNSLVTPLSFSPLSKKPQSWKGRRALTSERGDDVILPGCSKRGRLGTRRLFKADMSCVCARTRPLVTYHKPKLFAFNSYNHGSSLDSGKSTSTFSSSVSSSSCSSCSSCNPVVLCSDCDCSSNRSLSSSNPSSRSHPMSSRSSGTHMCHHFQRVLAREEWFQRPLVINTQLSSPLNYRRRSSTPLHNGKKYKQRRHQSRVMDLSPIRSSGSTRGQHSRASQRKRKRRRIHGLMEDEEHGVYQLCDLEDSSDDVLEENCTRVSRKQVSQSFVRKRQGESMYNINNIVIPVSLAKVEKPQYKDILTPSWRVVDPLSLMEVNAEEDTEEGQVEDLGDEFFARRHLALEQKEKLRWSSWGKRKCCRHTRSGSRLSGSGGGMYTSGEESSAEWSCAQLDTDEQPRAEERLPQTPWEPRVFPLDEDEEVALFSDELEKAPSALMECSSVSSTSKNSNSQLSPVQSACATLPSHGQSKNGTPKAQWQLS